MREFTGPSIPVFQVEFVPGERTRIAAATATELFIWDLDNVNPANRFQFRGRMSTVTVLEVSPDGQWIVAGPPENLDAVNVNAGNLNRPMTCPQLYCAHFVGSSERLTVIYRAEANGQTRLMRGTIPVALSSPTTDRFTPIEFKLDDVQERALTAMGLPFQRHTVALSNNGSRLAIPLYKVVFLWNAVTGECLGAIKTRGIPCGISLSPDGSRLAIDSGTTVYIHESTTLELVSKWKAKYCYGPGLAWSADGRLLGRADATTAARIFEVETGREVYALGKKRGTNWCIAFSPDGMTFATGTYDGAVRLWDLE